MKVEWNTLMRLVEAGEEVIPKLREIANAVPKKDAENPHYHVTLTSNEGTTADEEGLYSKIEELAEAAEALWDEVIQTT